MITNFDRDGLIQKLHEQASGAVKAADKNAFQRFIELFLANYPMDTWQSRPVTDLFACCLGLWHALQVPLKGDQARINVYNPNIDEHKWQCGRTVINVLQRDMPFLVDSLRLELIKQNILIHTIKSTVLDVSRKGASVSALSSGSKSENKQACEALIYIEISLQPQAEEREALRESLTNVLSTVDAVVEDYHPMLGQLEIVKTQLETQHVHKKNQQNTQESIALVEWLAHSNFSFLGFREFDWIKEESLSASKNSKSASKTNQALQENISKRLGLFKHIATHNEADQNAQLHITPALESFYKSDDPISFSKSATRSNVHRNVYPDYIVIKKYEEGEVVGEYRFLGLFTYRSLSLSPNDIPIVRQKIAQVIMASDVDESSHSGKNISRVIENFPREELFQSDQTTLTKNVLAIADINERHVVRLIMRDDPFGNFVNCLVYVPKENYNTQVREKIERVIGKHLHSDECDSTTYFSESILARAHIVFKVNDPQGRKFDCKSIENEIVSLIKNWEDSLQTALIESKGESKGFEIFSRYRNAFSSGYQEIFDSRNAAHDVTMCESLSSPDAIAMNFYRTLGDADNVIRFKVIRMTKLIMLSDIIPILENLGLRVIGERPYKIIREQGAMCWLHEFELFYNLSGTVDVDVVRDLFQHAFHAIWKQQVQSDLFNKLVLGARLDWREANLLRVYAAYMKQTGFSSGTEYIANTLAKHLTITREIVALFKAIFDPKEQINESVNQNFEQTTIEKLRKSIAEQLDSVSNLNEDKVLRRYVELFEGTLRTNFFQVDKNNQSKEYVAIKFNPIAIDDIPEPKPHYEIFVFSPKVEGVHLRGGKVARGGLRWSDRLEDYRTEVLGLVKAQQVKNAVIVPHGAKGGFVAKKMPSNLTRDEFMAYGINCYKIFIRALLDVTDNIVENTIVPPENLVRRDEDDPYLVVAADKGTATFSDIANGISEEYGHWLGDAFASGGSQGYDHKGMGITAKGAWVSVQRHFREKNKDIQNEAFSVIGIGDMAGDVFGNGMLLSKKIQLLAAFNHLHIFVDPNPDTEKSFEERQRLFNLPRSSWEDYNSDLISEGGAIFNRDAKNITLTSQIKKVFDISQDKMTPNEFIHQLLKAPVDLMWNGGIGTYVKSSEESDAQVGDKANDCLRINGNQLRAKVFGEGGNLGMSQLGRIEFCLNGGACNTDFIDNAAGVDCSDHEVNIKILLDGIVREGDLTSKQRNKILADMTDAVSDLVLQNNYRQTFAISLAIFQVRKRVNEYRKFINYLEANGKLNRELEFLPTDEEISDRHSRGKTLTSPELSVLISYAKVVMKEAFIDADLTDDNYVVKEVETAFPALVNKNYKEKVYAHKLLKEIVGTQVANDLINNLGITAGQRLIETTGATVKDIAKAYIISRDVFQLNEFQDYLKTLDNNQSSAFQAELMIKMVRRVRRGTRWFLRNRRAGINVGDEVKTFRAGLETINAISETVVSGQAQQDWQTRRERYLERGVPIEWATRLAMPDNLFSGLCVVEAAMVAKANNEEATETFYLLLDRLNLNWFAAQVSDVNVDSYWQALARESFIDDLEAQVRRFIVAFVRLKGGDTWDEVFRKWETKFEFLLARWRAMITEIQGNQATDYAMFSVAMRELIDLAQATTHCKSL